MRNLNPSTERMWRAYAIAPLAAPVAFILLFWVAVVVWSLLGHTVNGASLVVLPMCAVTIGVAGSYLVALVLGMPIAFLLRSARLLNFWTIHGAALLWAVVFSYFDRCRAKRHPAR